MVPSSSSPWFYLAPLPLTVVPRSTATKHAVAAFTGSLSRELVNSPIRVTTIAPGMVETNFSVTRFRGDKAAADAVYNQGQPTRSLACGFHLEGLMGTQKLFFLLVQPLVANDVCLFGGLCSSRSVN